MTVTDPSWPYYFQTVLHFEGLRVRADLREKLRPGLAAKLRGIGPSFAVITAYNPYGRAVSKSQNDLQHTKLRDALQRAHTRCVEVKGCSPDVRHCEVGLAADLDGERAVELAVRFGQTALFWFDGSSFWLIPAANEHPILLPCGPKES